MLGRESRGLPLHFTLRRALSARRIAPCKCHIPLYLYRTQSDWILPAAGAPRNESFSANFRCVDGLSGGCTAWLLSGQDHDQIRLGRFIMQTTICNATSEAAATRKIFPRCDSEPSAKTPPTKVRRNGSDQSQGLACTPVVTSTTRTRKHKSGAVFPK